MRTFAQKPKGPQQTTSAKSTAPGQAHLGRSHHVHSILHSQRTLGNQAALRLLEANTRNVTGDTTTGTAHLGFDFSRIPVHAPAAPARLQTKLAVGAPGDAYEQEADRVAEQVMRTPEVAATAREPLVQRKTAEHGQAETGDVPEIVHDVLRSPGQPLDADTRAFMEPRFEQDFSDVRVHADARAAHAALSIGARAFCVGRDIVLGAGEHSVDTNGGRRLLAHELTHVLQTPGGQLRRQGPPEALHLPQPGIMGFKKFKIRAYESWEVGEELGFGVATFQLHALGEGEGPRWALITFRGAGLEGGLTPFRFSGDANWEDFETSEPRTIQEFAGFGSIASAGAELVGGLSVCVLELAFGDKIRLWGFEKGLGATGNFFAGYWSVDSIPKGMPLQPKGVPKD